MFYLITQYSKIHATCLILDEHWKIIKLITQLFDLDFECTRKNMSQGLIYGLNRYDY